MQLNALLLALLALAACPGDDDPCPADRRMIGDPNGTPTIEIGEVRADGTWVPIADEGGTLTLFTPPQGGKIALIGARIHDMGGCRAQLVARLRDPTAEGEPVEAREGRTMRYRPIPGRPGWGEADAADPLDGASNIPACFDYADRDMDGCAWILHVSVEDDAGRLAEKRVTVVPECMVDDPLAPDPASCQCECAANYDERPDGCNDLDPWRDAPPACE